MPPPLNQGWVEESTRKGPQKRVPKGWAPEVGVGADENDYRSVLSMTPEQEFQRNRRFGWDIGNRFSELGSAFRTNPLWGAANAAFLVPEAISSAVRYGGGVIHGAQQAAVEGWRGSPLQGEERVVHHPFLNFESRTLPRVQNIFDPAEANARYEAIMHPAAQLGAELLAPARILPPGLKAGAQTAFKAPGLRGLVDRAPMPVVKPAWVGAMEQAAGAMAPITSHPGRSSTALAGLAAAASFIPDRDEMGNEVPVEARLARAAQVGLGGFVLGQGVTRALDVAGRGWTRAANYRAPLDDALEYGVNLSPETKRVYEELAGAQRAKEGGVLFEGSAPLYPGGYRGLVWDSMARQEITDDLAVVQTYQNWAERARGSRLPESERGYDHARQMAGVSSEVHRAVQRDIGQRIRDMGVTAKNQHLIDKLYFTRAALDRQRNPGHFATGPTLQGGDTPEAWETATRVHAETRMLVNHATGDPGMADKWEAGLQDITQNVLNPILRRLEGNTHTKEEIDDMIAKFPIYAPLEAVEYMAQDFIKSGMMSNPKIAPTKGVQNVHPESDISTATIGGLAHHVEKLMKVEQGNKVAHAIAEWSKYPGLDKSIRKTYEVFNRETKRWETKPWEGGDSAQVPAGWEQIPHWVPGQKKPEWLLVQPQLKDALVNMNPVQLGKIGEAIANFNQPFRFGVTSGSMSFLFRNLPRDVQQTWQNLGGKDFMRPTALQDAIGSWMEVMAEGVDRFVLSHQDSPWITGLPGKIARGLAEVERSRVKNPGLEDYFRTRSAGAEYVGAMTRPSDVARELNLPGRAPEGLERVPLFPGGITLQTPMDFMSALAWTLETGTRLTAFKVKRATGKYDETELGMLTRGASVDFSKGGRAMKTASLFLPLLNARVQGSLRTFEAAAEDPTGFMLRTSAMVTVPTVAAYAWNRLMFNDLYDKVSLEERDRNHIVVLGSYTDEDTGETRPIYSKIAKNEVTAAFSTPIEHLMDAMFHTKNGEQELPESQRNDRTDAQMWLGRLASFLPVSVTEREIANPMDLAMAGITMNPLVATIAGLKTNQDFFSDRHIVPPDMLDTLPPQYQYDNRTPQLTRGLSVLLKKAGFPEDIQTTFAPARTAFMMKSLGGTAASTFLGTGDQIVDAINLVGPMFGLPPVDFRPHDTSQLGLPATADPAQFERYVDKLHRGDPRPWWTRAASMAFGTSGGQQTVTAKASQSLSAQERNVWEATRKFQEEYSEAERQIEIKTQELYQAATRGEFTHVQLDARLGALDDERRGRFDALRQTHPLAITDYNQRKAFIERLPGPLANQQFINEKSELPAGTDLSAYVERIKLPPAIAALQAKGMPVGERQLNEARSLELRKISTELNKPVPLMREALAAAALQKELPALGVPALWLDEMVAFWRSPYDTAKGETRYNIDPQEINLRRQTYLKDKAAEMGLSEADLFKRLSTRLGAGLEWNNQIANSRDVAFTLSNQVRNPRMFPEYADPKGNAIGNQNDWNTWDAALKSEAFKKHPMYERIREAKNAAELKKRMFLMSDPGYAHYERWFGSGRTLRPGQWERFTSGDLAKYKDKPTAQEALKRDAFVKLYRFLPPALREVHKPTYDRLTKEFVNPEWRAALALDEAERQDLEYGDEIRALSSGR